MERYNFVGEKMPVGIRLKFAKVKDLVLSKLKMFCLLVLNDYCFAWDVPKQVFLCPNANSVEIRISLPESSYYEYEWASDENFNSKLGDGTSYTVGPKFAQKSVFVRRVGSPDVKEVKIGNVDYIGIDNIVQGNSGYLCVGGSVELKPEENYNGRLKNESFNVSSYVEDRKYEWKYDGCVVGTTKLYNAKKPGNYTLKFSVNECSVEKTVVVESEKKLLQLSGSDAICNGGSLILEVDGMDKYEWKGDVTQIDGSKKVKISSAGEYTVVGSTTIGGCKDSMTFNIQEKKSLDVKIDGVYALCSGTEYTELTAYVKGVSSESLTFKWTDKLGRPKGEGQTIKITEAGNYKVTVSDGNCDGSLDRQVEFVSNVGPISLSKKEIVICAGNKGSVNASGTNLTVFKWFDSNQNDVTINDGTNHRTFETKKEGVYSVIGYTEEGCPSEKTEIKAKVVDNPGLILPDLKPCEGEEPKLRAQFADSLDFIWISPATIIGEELKEIIVKEDGKYTATVQDNTTGCQTTTSVDIKFLPLPTITGTDKYQICEGSETILSFTTVKDGKLTGVPKTYTWTDEEGNKLSAGDSTLKVSKPGKYKFSADNAYGCTSEKEVEVITMPIPKVSVKKDKDYLCGSDDVVTLTATGDGIVSYEWISGGNVLKSGPTYGVNVAGNYKLRVKGNNGCTADTFVSVESKSKAKIKTIIPDICEGNTGKIEVESNKESDYLWENNGATTNYREVSASGNYVVKVTDKEFGCSQNVTLTVNLKKNPIVSISPSSTFICEGDNVLLTASGSSTNGKNLSYSWESFSNTSNRLFVSSEGIYKVTVTDGLGCKSSKTAEVKVNPLPVISLTSDKDSICVGESVTLTANGADKYTWSVGSKTSASITDSPTSTRTYTVFGTNSATGCKSNPVSKTIEVSSKFDIKISGLTSICEGQNFKELTASGANHYAWYN